MTFIHIPQTWKTSQRVEDSTGRFYLTPTGNRYPSITSVLATTNKDWLVKWKKKVGEEEAERIIKDSSTHGTGIHSLCEAYLKNEPIMFPTIRSKVAFTAMRKELNKLNNIQCLETCLWSDGIKVAGTVDCIAEYEGVLSIIDFKTSAKVKKEEWILNYFLQGTAYAIMYEEMTGIKIHQVVIIIAVSYDVPQVFKIHPDDYKKQLMDVISNYYAQVG